MIFQIFTVVKISLITHIVLLAIISLICFSFLNSFIRNVHQLQLEPDFVKTLGTENQLKKLHKIKVKKKFSHDK